MNPYQTYSTAGLDPRRRRRRGRAARGGPAPRLDELSGPGSWFHWHGGVFFRRADDGAVEIGHGPGFDDVHVDHSIDANSWASIVSSVSARGENHVTFYEALELHNVCASP